MVTIITGLPLDNPSTLSGPMQVGHGVMFGRVWNGEEVPESTPSDQTAAFFLFHHPFPSPSTTCPRVWEVRPSSVCPPPNSTGSLAGRCTCQCGHQECSGLLQAVEGDWLRPTPRPCSGADSRSLLPSLAARTTTCSHPTTRRLTHAHRKEAQLHTGCREGPGASWEGGVPLLPRRRQESKESAWSRRGLWAPSQPSCLSPPAFPRGRWQARVSAFRWSGSWTSEGKGQQKGPFFLTDAGWLVPGVWALWAWG